MVCGIQLHEYLTISRYFINSEYLQNLGILQSDDPMVFEHLSILQFNDLEVFTTPRYLTIS